MRRWLIAGTVAVAATMGTATAQEAGSRFSVGGGAGLTAPFHGDLDFTATGWEVAGRGRPAAHLSVEAFASLWRHTTETVRSGVPLGGGPPAVGSTGDLVQRTIRQTWAFGASLLPTVALGRVTLAAGGGANVMFFQRRFDQRIDQCTPAVSGVCGAFSNTHTASDLGVHALASVDVQLAPRLIGFAQYRVLVPVRDPGSGHAAVVGGLRLGVR